jgi:hypothetical protein
MPASTRTVRVARVPLRPLPLSQVLAYRHPAVVDRFRTAWDVGTDEADELWADTLRWLWLCASSPTSSMFITASMTLVDEMWHGFLLTTRDYAAFCDAYLGRFIHHQPGADGDAGGADQQRAALRAQIARVYDRLGPEVARRWYDDYQRRYPATALGLRFRAWRMGGQAP